MGKRDSASVLEVLKQKSKETIRYSKRGKKKRRKKGRKKGGKEEQQALNFSSSRLSCVTMGTLLSFFEPHFSHL